MFAPAKIRCATYTKKSSEEDVAVYKLDRLTRSLADFAKIVEQLDKQRISFVSVTQQFNPPTSMDRLTLNGLLSFVQFERKVTGERICTHS
ncbi:MAG: recombinase family protein [Bryocella sp.]